MEAKYLIDHNPWNFDLICINKSNKSFNCWHKQEEYETWESRESHCIPWVTGEFLRVFLSLLPGSDLTPARSRNRMNDFLRPLGSISIINYFSCFKNPGDYGSKRFSKSRIYFVLAWNYFQELSARYSHNPIRCNWGQEATCGVFRCLPRK